MFRKLLIANYDMNERISSEKQITFFDLMEE